MPRYKIIVNTDAVLNDEDLDILEESVEDAVKYQVTIHKEEYLGRIGVEASYD